MYDALTGLYSRRAFTELAEKLVAYYNRHCFSMAFIMIDVDYFKDINDSYGHQTGDEVLKAVAARIKSNFRKEDIVGRLGGDEFAAMMTKLPDQDAAVATAVKVAETIRQAFDYAGATFNLSVSIGICYCDKRHNGASLDLKTVLARTDAALYEAKNSGRDCYRLTELKNEH